jgi:hypothetical protein
MPARPNRLIFALAVLSVLSEGFAAYGQPPGGFDGSHRPPPVVVSSRTLSVRSGTIQVDFAQGDLDLSPDAILQHIHTAADAIVAYYGRLPVARARILVVPVDETRGEMGGTTWPGRDGFQAFTRLRIGRHFTAAQLADDWVTTHEMVHWAFPSMPDDQHWIEEGTATYVEPLARVMTGELPASQVWADMVHGMPHGEPATGDAGMDQTHTWGRTYWGGALFCLVADVEIRRETNNRKGLQDALRAVVAAGGTIDHDWSLDKALDIGDRATGTHVLTAQYAAWKDKPVPVDLPSLWAQLGVRSACNDGEVEFVTGAPLAKIREAIADKPKLHSSATPH